MSQPSLKQVIPDGYKQTEVGLIPEDWCVSTLGQFVHSLEAGISVNSVNKLDAFSHGKHVLKTSCVSKGYFYPKEAKSIIPNDVSRAKTIPTEGAIIVSRMNTPDLVGELGFIDGIYTNLFLPDRLWQMRFRSSVKTNTRWLAYILSFPAIAKKIKESATGTSNSMKNISKGSLLSVGFPSPEYKEQTAIANALSDVDLLLSELEKLISKKQAIKTATMQQLLTGKTRLPQFSYFQTDDGAEGELKNKTATQTVSQSVTQTTGTTKNQGKKKGTKPSELGEIPEDWEVYLIEEVIDSLSSGGTPFRGNSSFYKGTNKWITSGELKYGVINDTFEKISDDGIKAAHLKVHPIGTFLMAITGLEAAGTRGSCGIIGKPATTNQSCMAIYPNKKLTSNFLFHWYVYNGEELALKYCQGTKQLSYTAGLLKTLPILLPKSTQEQTAIATMLSVMDEEIQTLTKRLSKTRQIKQGMMQELLTGKTRLIQGETHD